MLSRVIVCLPLARGASISFIIYYYVCVQVEPAPIGIFVST